MDIKKIAKNLPNKPRPCMAEDVALHCRQQLGPEFCLFKRVSSSQVINGFDGWSDLYIEDETPAKWVAECSCGVCGETWYSGITGNGILMIVGDDGQPYTGVPRGTDCCWDTGIPIDEGNELVCPMCGEKVKLIRKKYLANGRTYRIPVGSVESVGKYTVVMRWMAERFVGSNGTGSIDIEPKHAVVIDEDGRLVFFSFDYGVWKYRKSTGDPFQLFYQTYGGAMGRTIGSWLWPDVPDQTGRTGEKTGLAAYFADGGEWPVAYLRFWQEYPAIENIVKAGWLKPFENSIDDEIIQYVSDQVGTYRKRAPLATPKDLLSLADWEKVRPHEMLCMTREELRAGYGRRWTAAQLDLWIGLAYEELMQPGDAAFFDRCVYEYGLGVMQKWADYADEHRIPAPLEKLDRYFHRQHEKYDFPLDQALSAYLDYIDMLGTAPEDLTEVEIFPPRLRAAHDRAMVSATMKADAKTIAAFANVREKWKALEWSDGHICAVLPRANSDLVFEGKALHHCVGGYGKDHVEGRVIVFIRHARRPERSWYTLNVDLTGTKWKEIQLHGYGNEYAHGKHLRIPREVRDFVDRWEKEVLTPTVAKVKAAEKKAAEKKTVKKKVKAA